VGKGLPMNILNARRELETGQKAVLKLMGKGRKLAEKQK